MCSWLAGAVLVEVRPATWCQKWDRDATDPSLFAMDAAAAAAAAAHSSLGAALRPPPPFDFDSPSTWPAWLLQFEDFSYATGLHTAEQEVQTRSMLYCMGPQARTVLASTTLSEADTKDLSAVKKAFTDLFVHPVNELYESARFHRRTQQPGETADVFFTAPFVPW